MPTSLHTHSWYSLLEGTASLATLLQRAADCGCASLALTDTNNLYGAVPFVAAAKRHGLRPLLGACLRQGTDHCVALIATPAGYRNVCCIISRLNGIDHGERRAPRGLRPLLLDHAEGLHILIHDLADAAALREAFGPRLWLEVVRPRIGISAAQEWERLEQARRLGIRSVASTAAHLAVPEEWPTYQLITAARQGLLLDQLASWGRQPPEESCRGVTRDHHLVDAATLAQRFLDLPEAIHNTDVLAEQLSDDVLPKDWVLPPAKLPRGIEADRFLRLLCERGLRQRFPPVADAPDSPAAMRLRDELAVIAQRGLAGYFLVVRDIARYARRRGHPMALRGSAGNSLVCYLLAITDVDPLRFGLPMERFLHAGRVDLPDIDLDFDWKVRDDVIAHAFERYGPARTAMISSHLFLQPRSAFREAAKLHGLSNDQISRLIDTLDYRIEERGSTIDYLGAKTDDGKSILAARAVPRGFPLEPARWPRIAADARRLLGRPHHQSIHPGGIVITPGPIDAHVPLQIAAKGIVITQFEKDAAEATGLVKIDLLGNRALATVAHASGSDTVAHASGSDTVAHASGSDVVTLLRRGDTLGVNQLESPAMRRLLVQMQPAGLEHVIQALAMIRPAAASIGAKESFVRRRRGLEPPRFAHPFLETVLGETYGLMLYEDDAMRVVQALTGLPGPAAELFRKRIAKHQTDAEAQELAKEFSQMCARHGVPRAVVEEQWVQLAKFNRYSFCKSHAVSYGLIAWRAAWLKTHRPVPFWTAALNNNQGIYPRRVYIEAIKRAGIRVLLPCVNRSGDIFTVEGDAIRTGLEAIGKLDEELRQRIVSGQPYQDLADFRRQAQPGPEALALLIRGGALDFTEQTRPALFLAAQLNPLPSELGFTSFHDDWQPIDYSTARRWQDEWETLGFLTGPPLVSLFQSRWPAGLVSSGDLVKHVGRRVRVAGLVAAGRHAETEDGRAMQFVTLEDAAGLMEVTLFPGMPLMPHLRLGPYVASGIVEEQYDVVTLTADQFDLLE